MLFLWTPPSQPTPNSSALTLLRLKPADPYDGLRKAGDEGVQELAEVPRS